jgi:uncharacterized protein
MPLMRKLVLDTNFLMIPGQLGVDIFEELRKSCNFPYELYTTSGNLEELKKIRETGNTKDRRAAKVAEELVKAKNLKIVAVERDKSIDDSLVELSDMGYLVATADRELQKRIKNYAFLRQKKYISFKGVKE